MPKKVLGVYLAADRKIGDIIFLARRKGFEPRQTGLAPRRSRAIGATALYPRPRSSSPNCASLRNFACGMRSAYIRFAKKNAPHFKVRGSNPPQYTKKKQPHKCGAVSFGTP